MSIVDELQPQGGGAVPQSMQNLVINTKEPKDVRGTSKHYEIRSILHAADFTFIFTATTHSGNAFCIFTLLTFPTFYRLLDGQRPLCRPNTRNPSIRR
jgi:hypothetical protein